MKRISTIAVGFGALVCSAGIGSAQSPEYMTEYCMTAAQGFYQEYEASTDTTYEGQRTDGTHAVNGTIFRENQSSDFQCSFNAAGDTMVDFFTDEQSWPDFANNGESPYNSGGGAGSGASTSSTERIKFPAGSTSFQFPAQLPPNSSVQYLLGAKNEQFLEVGVYPESGSMDYMILNPDGSVLLDAVPSSQEYRGQLWQSGDHVVEVINRGGETLPFEIYFSID
jgi:hypothetical protein